MSLFKEPIIGYVGPVVEAPIFPCVYRDASTGMLFSTDGTVVFGPHPTEFVGRLALQDYLTCKRRRRAALLYWGVLMALFVALVFCSMQSAWHQ